MSKLPQALPDDDKIAKTLSFYGNSIGADYTHLAVMRVTGDAIGLEEMLARNNRYSNTTGSFETCQKLLQRAAEAMGKETVLAKFSEYVAEYVERFFVGARIDPSMI